MLPLFVAFLLKTEYPVMACICGVAVLQHTPLEEPVCSLYNPYIVSCRRHLPWHAFAIL